ncbi:MAG: hypothetical protein QOJ89_604 [bacterium]|jgi:hypothetical protein
MIYCVVPEALEDELFEKLTAYYADDDNVTVIVDRRKSDRRNRRPVDGGDPPKPDPEAVKQREIRDRRRARVPGEFPSVDRE